MKRFIYMLAAVCLIILTATSCKDMDDNYSQYLENIPTYSPAVRNLSAVSPEAGTLTLKWDLLDETNLVKAIRIVVKKTKTDTFTIDIPEYTIPGLDLQAYEFDVFTVDDFGNLSIPITAIFTPIPGRE